MIQQAIVKIVNKEDLTYDEAYAVMNEIMGGQTTPTQNAAFLAALSTKSARAETIDEIAGCAAAMRAHATRVDTGMDLIEIVGTGGDNAHSFNISTTAALVAAFTQGAEAAGHQVTTFFLEELDLHGCRGCFGGHSSQPCPCVQKDDMAKIYPAVKASDVVVLASPLYYWGFSGQLKLALDRLFALEEGDGNLLRGHGRASALLMAAEGDGFADALLYYDHLMEHLQWKNLGHVLAGGNWDVGDIQGKPELDQARALGASLG